MHKLIEYYKKRIVRTKMPTHTHTQLNHKQKADAFIYFHAVNFDKHI